MPDYAHLLAQLAGSRVLKPIDSAYNAIVGLIKGVQANQKNTDDQLAIINDIISDVSANSSDITKLTIDHYVTTRSESNLANEFSLGSLTTGLLKHTVASSISTPATATPATDYVAPGAITTSGLTQATGKILGRTTASTGAIEEISAGTNITIAGGTISAAGTGGGTVPTTGWTIVNAAIVNDYLTPRKMGILIKDNAALNWRFVHQALPAATYTFIASVQGYFQGFNSTTFGFYLYDGTKLIGFEVLNQATASGGVNRLRVERMNSITSDNATMAGATINLTSGLLTVKIVNNGINRIFYYWDLAGGGWVTFYTEAFNAFLTETKVGCGGVCAANNIAVVIPLSLEDWSLV